MQITGIKTAAVRAGTVVVVVVAMDGIVVGTTVKIVCACGCKYWKCKMVKAASQQMLPLHFIEIEMGNRCYCQKLLVAEMVSNALVSIQMYKYMHTHNGYITKAIAFSSCSCCIYRCFLAILPTSCFCGCGFKMADKQSKNVWENKKHKPLLCRKLENHCQRSRNKRIVIEFSKEKKNGGKNMKIQSFCAHSNYTCAHTHTCALYICINKYVISDLCGCALQAKHGGNIGSRKLFWMLLANLK